MRKATVTIGLLTVAILLVSLGWYARGLNDTPYLFFVIDLYNATESAVAVETELENFTLDPGQSRRFRFRPGKPYVTRTIVNGRTLVDTFLTPDLPLWGNTLRVGDQGNELRVEN